MVTNVRHPEEAGVFGLKFWGKKNPVDWLAPKFIGTWGSLVAVVGGDGFTHFHVCKGICQWGLSYVGIGINEEDDPFVAGAACADKVA